MTRAAAASVLPGWPTSSWVLLWVPVCGPPISPGLLDLGPAYRLVVPAISLTTVLLAARAVLNGAAQGLFRFGQVAVNQVLEVAIKFSAGLSLVAVGFGVAGVMAGFAIGTAAALLHSLWIVRPDRLWTGRGWLDRQVVLSTAPLFVGMLGPALILNLDILGLKLLAPGQGDALAGFYQAAVILARIPVFTARALTMVVFSYVASSRRQPSQANYGRAAVRAWQRLLLPASVALFIAPQTFIGLIYPDSYQLAASYLRIAAVGGGLLSLMTLLMGIAQAGGQRRPSAVVALVATLAQILVLVLVVPAWGATGAAWSLVLAGTVGVAGLAPLFLQRQSLNAAKLVRALVPLVAMALLLALLPDGGRLAALFKLAAAGAAYLLVLAAMRYPVVASRRAATSTKGAGIVYEILIGA